MFCSKCGNQLENNDKFCAKCGNSTIKIDESKEIDTELPNNNNFIFTLLFMFFLFFLAVTILAHYQEENKYASSIQYQDYTFNVPLGYTATIDTEKEDNNEPSLLIKNNDIIFEYLIYDNYYNEYKEDDYFELRDFFKEKKYTVKTIDEIDQNNHKMIYALFDYQKNEEDDDYYAFYMSRIKETDKMVWGYIYKTSEVNVDDIYKSLDIVNNIQ